MIMLEMDKQTRFNGTDKWPLLFAIADVFRKYSSEKKPLSTDDVSAILNQEYGIEKIDRHVVRDYRERLETYFSYNFIEVKKKGYYLKDIDYAINDDDLVALAVMVQYNTALSKEAKQFLLPNLACQARRSETRELIESTINVEIIGSNANATEKTALLVQRLLKSIRKETRILVRYPERANLRREFRAFYPQCVFTKNNEFYLLGQRYEQIHDHLVSDEYVCKVRNIVGLKIEDGSKTDPYQNDDGTITIFPIGEDPKTYPLSDYISMLGDIKEGVIYGWDMTEQIMTAKIEIGPHETTKTIGWLKDKYGDRFVVKKYFREESGNGFGHRKALAVLSLPRKELANALFANPFDVKLLGPQKTIRFYQQALKLALSRQTGSMDDSPEKESIDENIRVDINDIPEKWRHMKVSENSKYKRVWFIGTRFSPKSVKAGIPYKEIGDDGIKNMNGNSFWDVLSAVYGGADLDKDEGALLDKCHDLNLGIVPLCSEYSYLDSDGSKILVGSEKRNPYLEKILKDHDYDLLVFNGRGAYRKYLMDYARCEGFVEEDTNPEIIVSDLISTSDVARWKRGKTYTNEGKKAEWKERLSELVKR